MIYRKDNVYIGSFANWAQNIYNYLKDYIPDVTYDGEYLIFPNGVKYRIYSPYSNERFNFDVTCNDGTAKNIIVSVYFDRYTYTFELILTDNFMFLYIAHGGNDKVLLSYIADEEGNYYAGGLSNSDNLYNASFYSIANSNTGVLKCVKLINFSASPGKIAISKITPITDNNIITFYAQDLISCSTVTSRSIVTIGGSNYLAVNSNTLVLYEE